MFDQEAIARLNHFFESENSQASYNFDRLLGALVAAKSCSEMASDAEFSQLFLTPEDPAALSLWQVPEGELQLAFAKIDAELNHALDNKAFDLSQLYPHAETDKAPSNEFSDWCLGYVHGYNLVNQTWQRDYKYMAENKNFSQSPEFIENCQAVPNAIATFAHWQQELANHAQPEVFENAYSELFIAAAQGVNTLYLMARVIDEEFPQQLRGKYARLAKAKPVTQQKPMTRDEPKVGRNDPCLCGSGKKYKKCCLH